MAYYRTPKQGLCPRCSRWGNVVQSTLFDEHYCPACYRNLYDGLYRASYRSSRAAAQRAFEEHHRAMCRKYFPDSFGPDGTPKDIPNNIDLAAIQAYIIDFCERRNACQEPD